MLLIFTCNLLFSFKICFNNQTFSSETSSLLAVDRDKPVKFQDPELKLNRMQENLVERRP